MGANYLSFEFLSPPGIDYALLNIGQLLTFGKLLASKAFVYYALALFPILPMLFSNELIFIAAEKTVLDKAEGGFARNLLVLMLEEPQAAANREFLTKVLAAANLNLSQDALLAEIPTHEPRNLAPVLQSHQPKQVLIFGLSAAQLGLSFEVQAYQPVQFYGCTWLFADKLSTLEPDKTKKSQLWTALKQIFL